MKPGQCESGTLRERSRFDRGEITALLFPNFETGRQAMNDLIFGIHSDRTIYLVGDPLMASKAKWVQVIFRRLFCSRKKRNGRLEPNHFPLADNSTAPHSLIMNDAGRLTFKIIRDPGANHRFRWLIYEEGRAVAYSPKSYATRREAEADVGKAMLRLAV
jgi:hypothetical protein